ncbi:MAG: M28 family peptidase [Chloroflexi bacterium]|nr:M28 family peptidase [Chloroflexota bacterium]
MKKHSDQPLHLLILAALILYGLSACAAVPAPAQATRSPGADVTAPAEPLEATAPPAETPTQAAAAEEQGEAANAPEASSNALAFDGERAYQDVEYQVSLGPRTPGSPAHDQVVAWMQEELSAHAWTVELQETTYSNQPVRNVIAKRGGSKTPWIIIGAHYDSRMKADQDAQQPDAPVPGANDGASGVAVLMELARVLPEDLDMQIWLVFFDAEDQGNLPGWNWIYGSRAFVESLESDPQSVIIVDMIGDADLNIYQERNSNSELTAEIWAAAAELGYNQFIPEEKYSILDDHTPFLERGIRAIDIIDFDYPYWHTAEDTPDKVSAESLKAVGDTLLRWIQPE